VELYLKATGLMWENYKDFKALMIFAEHRYFGKSLPFDADTFMKDHRFIQWLTPDQALADYSKLIWTLKREWNSEGSAVIGFGGSYGGMLCTWLRIKYPAAVQGCIASSAPVMSFMGLTPPYDPNGFNRAVTDDASAKNGASDTCSENVRRV